MPSPGSWPSCWPRTPTTATPPPTRRWPTSRPCASPATPRWRRASWALSLSVPALLFWGVILLLAGALLTSIFLMRGHIARQQPVGVITPAQHEQARDKERTLAMLDALAESGRHEEALRGYDDYLKRYPNSTK